MRWAKPFVERKPTPTAACARVHSCSHDPWGHVPHVSPHPPHASPPCPPPSHSLPLSLTITLQYMPVPYLLFQLLDCCKAITVATSGPAARLRAGAVGVLHALVGLRRRSHCASAKLGVRKPTRRTGSAAWPLTSSHACPNVQTVAHCPYNQSNTLGSLCL